jgi:hypothetical protein
MFGRNGLGGHMSRVHQGKSKEFKKKKETRELRAKDRLDLRLAQAAYRKIYSCPDIRNIQMERQKLVRIKEKASTMDFDNVSEEKIDELV